MDAVQRAIEGLSYRQAHSPGSFKLKAVIKQAINIILRSGKVKKVYFNVIVLKP